MHWAFQEQQEVTVKHKGRVSFWAVTRNSLFLWFVWWRQEVGNLLSLLLPWKKTDYWQIHRGDRAQRILTKKPDPEGFTCPWIKLSLNASTPGLLKIMNQKCFCFSFREFGSGSLFPAIRGITQMLRLKHLGWYFSLPRFTSMPMKKSRKGKVVRFFTRVATFCLTHSLKMRSNSALDCSGSRVTPGRQCRDDEVHGLWS